MIEALSLTKQYGPHKAVDGLTFTIREGQVYGFLGPNGAGKTTAMNMLAGYLAPTAGTVRVDGIDMGTDPIAAKRALGYLPEVPPLYPEMTVREYLRFAASVKGISRAEIREETGRVMEALSLADMEHRLIRALSKGYRQRTGFAAALLGDPKNLLLDEPTAGLDPKQITQIRELIGALGRDHAVLISSHILSEISEVCGRVLILSGGKLTAQGSPADLAQKTARQAVSVLTDGAEREIRAALAPCAGAPAVSVRPENGRKRVTITGTGAEDLSAKVTAALVSAGLPVYEIRAGQESLEDIFLDATKEEA